MGILGIEVSANNFCFDNGAIIIPSLNCGVDGQVLESDVKESQEKTPTTNLKRALFSEFIKASFFKMSFRRFSTELTVGNSIATQGCKQRN